MAFDFSIREVIDILFFAFVFYEIFILLRRSGVVNLFWGILAFVILWSVVKFIYPLELTGALFDRFISVGAIALIVIFQDEIRSFFYRIGSKFSSWQWHIHKTEVLQEQSLQQIVLACKHLSRSHTGALIIIEESEKLSEYCKTGEKIEGKISARLIENIFFKNTPLHDGAMIITQNLIDSAACILPVSKSQEIPQHYGLRHRAALGISEKTDALAIIVSEETGKISIAHHGDIREANEESLVRYISSSLAGPKATTK